MRKNISVILSLLLMCSLCGCGDSTSENVTESADEAVAESAEENSAESTVESVAENAEENTAESTVESVTENAEEAESVSEASEESEEVSESPWKMGYFVDEFEREDKDKPYIAGTFTGKFSNSATTGSDAIVRVILTDVYRNASEDSKWALWAQIGRITVTIELYEYGEYKVGGRSFRGNILEENDNIIEDIKFWDTDSDGKYMIISCYKDKDNVYHSDQVRVINALRNNKKITLSLKEYEGNSSYLVDIDCTGFSELFDNYGWHWDELTFTLDADGNVVEPEAQDTDLSGNRVRGIKR